ncbi:MAG: phosphoribosylaminoimidazolesuccinocarboxamide synthase [Erysipelotrichales bacterium]
MEAILYEGKAKQILHSNEASQVIMRFKDDATAFNGIKKASIKDKGILNNKISSKIYEYLNSNGINTHYIKCLDSRSQLTTKVDVIPLEFIIRNKVAGSMATRLGLNEGDLLNKPVLEICYKDDSLNDPLINDDHVYSLNILRKEQLDYCYKQVLLINDLLKNYFSEIGIILVDLKLEFGFDNKNNIILVDEISPDNCRLWDKETNEKLDKDVFRLDLNDLKDTYEIVLEKIESRY